jgi:Uma2 family endonuclease
MEVPAMVEVKFGMRTVDLPYTIRLYDVTEEKFDELVDEDMKAELIDGVMIVHSPASPRHNRIAGFLRGLMGSYAEETGQGEVFGPDDLVHLASCRRFAPDGFYLDADRVPVPLPQLQFEGAPDQVVEVLSTSNREDDLEDKRPAYRQARVRETWFVDPVREEVIVDRRGRKEYATTIIREGRLTSKVVKGFWIDVAWLWSEPRPRVLTCLREILG